LILILQPWVVGAARERVVRRISELGFRAAPSADLPIVCVLGADPRTDPALLKAIPGVERVVAVSEPYVLAARAARGSDSVVEMGGARFGGGSFAVIAGPCAVEDRETTFAVARAVRDAGACLLRGGAFKPRTSPYAFRGLGEDGLKILSDAAAECGLGVVTEVLDVRDLDLVARYADGLQVGSRNMQNYPLLAAVGRAGKPVLLKRGMAATVRDLLLSAEYLLEAGNPAVVLCERGVRGFDDATRNLLDLAAVAALKKATHLPVVVDPSHATGRAELVPPMAKAAVPAGADGIMVEVHPAPERAKSDGRQSLLPGDFAELMRDLARILALEKKTLVRPAEEVRA